jgi:GNAT superfamily N-acetyltransferase
MGIYNGDFDNYLIKPAIIEDISYISRYHYMPFARQPYVKAWKITDIKYGKRDEPIGVITYSMPVLNCAARRSAIGDFLADTDKRIRLRRLNEFVRRISRVVIDPRYRGLGLAAWLVRRTMPQMEVPMIEATAVMGKMSGFFERAGMHLYKIPVRPEAATLAGALLSAEIKPSLWIDAAAVYAQIQPLPEDKKESIKRGLFRFLGAYGKRRTMAEGVESLRFALSRLNARPGYYVWLNPNRPLKGLELISHPPL